MSDTTTSWFHCGRCGAMFQSPPGEWDERTCTSCGEKPSLGIEGLQSVRHADDAAATSPDTNEPAEKAGRKGPRRRKANYFMVKLILCWMVLILIIIFGARALLQMSPEEERYRDRPLTGTKSISAADIALLDEAIPLCKQAFSSFLTAGTPESRNQSVSNPIATASRMVRFYDLNPLITIDPQSLTLAYQAVIHLPDRRAIEAQWHDSDGRQLDSVFVEESGEWRLDWDHFARHSDYPWSLYLAGSGPDRGEFRLLARERLAEERKNSDSMSVVFYAPRFGYPKETGFQSPEFLIKRDTTNGRLLDAAFKLERSGKRVFDVNLPTTNPEGIIRIRGKFIRIDEGADRRFELDRIVACHWYSVDAPGVELPDQPLPK